MTWNDEERHDRNGLDASDHDRLVRLEERVSQWMSSVERRLGVQHQTVMWIVGLIGTAGVGLVVGLITGGDP